MTKKKNSPTSGSHVGDLLPAFTSHARGTSLVTMSHIDVSSPTFASHVGDVLSAYASHVGGESPVTASHIY